MEQEFYAVVTIPYYPMNFILGTITKVKTWNGSLTHVYFLHKNSYHEVSNPTGWSLDQFDLFPVDNKLLRLISDV